MSLWNVIKSLNHKQILSAFFLFLKQPLFIYPTLRATFLSYTIAQQEFPNTHHLNGKGNAFRHAFWNMMLCRENAKWTFNKNKAIIWAKKITDWHEELSPNKPLDKAMDLHNNEVGRQLFLEISKKDIRLTTDVMVTFLKEKLEDSHNVKTIVEMDAHKEALVYITEFN